MDNEAGRTRGLMLKHGFRRLGRGRWRSQAGSTFVEVLVAMTILGLIAASFPPAILFSTKAVFAQQERTIAENLSKNQVEYLKSCDYVESDGDYPVYEEVPVPDDSYDVIVTARPIHIDPDTLAHEVLPPTQDEGIQEITVQIEHVDRVVLTTTCHKVQR